MNTYFVYIEPSKSAKFPELNRYLRRLKAEEFGKKSSTIYSSKKIDKLLTKIFSFVGKKGFVFVMSNTPTPHNEPGHYLPKDDQHKLLKPNSDLDVDSGRWLEMFAKD
jgi:hypothetical protein